DAWDERGHGQALKSHQLPINGAQRGSVWPLATPDRGKSTGGVVVRRNPDGYGGMQSFGRATEIYSPISVLPPLPQQLRWLWRVQLPALLLSFLRQRGLPTEKQQRGG
ncbi:unnamed protein product, partial [Ectocarpus sp. 12 AP-2014]